MGIPLPRRRLALIFSAWLAAGAVAGVALVAGRSGSPAPEPAATAPVSRLVLRDPASPAPAFGFTDASGAPLSLDSFKGRTVLLNVWATWCAPCRKEMPSLDRLQAEMGGADFQVVALSIDRGGLDAVRAFFSEVGLAHLGIYLDPTSASTRALNVVGIPTTVLIDGEGREVGRATGPAEWDSPEMKALIRQGMGRSAADLPSTTEERRS
ncbi:TlpA family protein disulfide reductase [Inquilinus limosus]|uniref:TlpA family protein disulfide reductase n=1 Tax=Inquilinus limosus TaxID=171674 RepID=UPI000416C60A|nr:TlpA disulfide reductase family protein [Inquilinus limosus]